MPRPFLAMIVFFCLYSDVLACEGCRGRKVFFVGFGSFGIAVGFTAVVTSALKSAMLVNDTPQAICLARARARELR